MAGQSITLTLPTVGEAGPGYASKLLTAIQALETELERPVVPADMDISANLSFLSGVTNYAATDLKYIQLTLQDEDEITAAGTPMTLFVGSADGELYFNDNSGRQIQLTTDGTVNVSTTGGITSSAGNYGETGVEIRWNSADGEYELRTGAGADAYADARLDDVVLNDGSSHFIRMTAPSLSADYTLTLPTLPAAAGTLLQIDTSGTVTAANTGLAATTFTGLVTASAGVTAGVNQNVTVSGTGKFKHGSEEITIPGLAFVQAIPLTNDLSYSTSPLVASNGSVMNGSTADISVGAPIILPVGKRITSVVFRGNQAAGGSTRRYRVRKSSAGTPATIGAEVTSTATGAVTPTFSSLTETIASGYVYWVEASLTEDLDLIYHVTITYDNP